MNPPSLPSFDSATELRAALERTNNDLAVLRARLEQSERNERLLAGESRILEMVAYGSLLTEVLGEVCHLIETLSKGALCGILLVDADSNRLQHGAAPSLPDNYNGSIHGRPVTRDSGPCAMAAVTREQVLSPDITQETRWPGQQWCDLALAHGLRACWSTPILSSEGTAQAIFAIYWRHPCAPTPEDQRLIQQTTHLVAVAIEHRRALTALQHSEQRLRHITDSIPGLVWSVEPDGEVDFLNQRWREYTGLSPTDARGWGWRVAIHPDDLSSLERFWRDLLASGQPGEFEARLKRHDGTFRWFLFRAVPWRDEAGRVLKWYGQNIDITERRQLEDRLRQSERNLAEGQRLTKTGSWVLDFKTGETDWSVETCRIFGFPDPPPSPHYSAFRARVRPEDRAAVDQGLRESFETGEPRPLEYVFVLPDGTRKHIETISQPVRDEDGTVVRLMGTVMDVTERKRTAEALRVSEHVARGQLEALASSLAALSREPEPEKFLEHVLRITCRQLSATSASIWEMNQHVGCVDLAVVYQDGVLHLPLHEEGRPPPRIQYETEDHPVWTEFFRTGRHCVFGQIEGDPAGSRVAASQEGPWFDWRAGIVDNPAVPRMIREIAAAGVVATLNVPMFVADKVAGLFVLCFKQRREYRDDEMELTRAMSHQAMLAMQLMRLSRQSRESAVIAERNRFARDMHDTLAQGFTGVIVQLEAAADATSRGLHDDANAHLRRAGDLARESLQEARRSVRALRPRVLQDTSFAHGLEALIRQTVAGTPVDARFSVHGDSSPLPPEWEENLLRVGQEVLTNVLRHANATRFTVELNFAATSIRLELADNGIGFDPTARCDGFGLLGIRERVETMGGQLKIASAPGLGTRVSIVLPVRTTSLGSS